MPSKTTLPKLETARHLATFEGAATTTDWATLLTVRGTAPTSAIDPPSIRSGSHSSAVRCAGSLGHGLSACRTGTRGAYLHNGWRRTEQRRAGGRFLTPG